MSTTVSVEGQWWFFFYECLHTKTAAWHIRSSVIPLPSDIFEFQTKVSKVRAHTCGYCFSSYTWELKIVSICPSYPCSHLQNAHTKALALDYERLLHQLWQNKIMPEIFSYDLLLNYSFSNYVNYFILSLRWSVRSIFLTGIFKVGFQYRVMVSYEFQHGQKVSGITSDLAFQYHHVRQCTVGHSKGYSQHNIW